VDHSAATSPTGGYNLVAHSGVHGLGNRGD
jgi:hypothetical protein